MGIGFAIPIYEHVHRQVDYFDEQRKQPAFFGLYKVIEYHRNGQIVEEDADSQYAWRTVKFERLPYNQRGEPAPTNWMTIGLSGSGTVWVQFDWREPSTLELSEHGNALVPKQAIHLQPLADGKLQLTGELANGEEIAVKLQRNDQKTFRLTGRGFRWISEVPFNR